MGKLQIIEQREVLGKDFKIYGDFESPLFLARDVAEWIEYDVNSTSKLVAMVDDSEKLTRTIFLSGQNREMWFLTEDGLYEIFMQSRKPIAKQYKRQVKEILKSIRKHGGYLTPETIEKVLNNPDTIIHLANQLKASQAQVRELEVAREVDKPLVEFANSVARSEDSISVGCMAKILKQNGYDTG